MTPPTSDLCSRRRSGRLDDHRKAERRGGIGRCARGDHGGARHRNAEGGEGALGFVLCKRVRALRRAARHAQLHLRSARPGLADRAGQIERLERFALALQRHDAGGQAQLARGG